MKLLNIALITGRLVCRSGLHIGAGDAEMHIGGVDNPVVRNPVTDRPYIPGSSLKGKMRSLLEWRSGAVREHPLGWEDYQGAADKAAVLDILKLFGVSGDAKLTPEEAALVGPTRLSFWDCPMSAEAGRRISEADALPTEVKAENSINRITGTASNPRFTERVVEGTAFDFRLSVRVLDADGDRLLKTALAGMRLMELDSLGGSGSRGYGKISFEDLKIDGRDIQAEFVRVDPFGRR